ncbi:MAG: HNH endonuclease [Candidatus Omnitrophica bacterium]|nr:HNH endonuclease [Candidatus Omnitrophota bacterium]
MKKGSHHSEETKKKMSGKTPWNKSTDVELRCKECGKNFYVILSRKNIAKYCSHKCYWENKIGNTPVNKGCFKKGHRPSPLAGFKKGSVPWNKGILVELKCKICDKVFYVPPCRKDIAKYCSVNCRSIYRGNMLKGKHLSEKTKRKISESQKREKSCHWKGGKFKTHGYILIVKPNHPFSNKKGYVKEHRFVMEQHLGRYLDLEEIVHHINGIKDDNRLENLKLCSNKSEHMKLHFPKGSYIGANKHLKVTK